MHEKHRERVRARFLENGADSFSDKNLLEFLLFFSLPRIDTNPVASRLLEKFGSLSGILSSDISELKKIKGMGPSSSILIGLVGELSRRLSRNVPSTEDDVLRILTETFSDNTKELFYIFSVDDGTIISDGICISEGCFDNVEININQLIDSVLLFESRNIVLVHNHPDGIVAPSHEDIENTIYLKKILNDKGFNVIDHYIYADGDYLKLSSTEKYKDLFN